MSCVVSGAACCDPSKFLVAVSVCVCVRVGVFLLISDISIQLTWIICSLHFENVIFHHLFDLIFVCLFVCLLVCFSIIITLQ